MTQRKSVRPMPWKTGLQRGWVLALLLIAVGGCSGIGPSTVKGNRYDYNTALQRSNDQQLLLNLVRLKYRDTPYFLEVNSVTAQFKFRANADASATLQDGVKGIFGLGAGAALEENPTVSYAPLQGEQFIQRFLSHVPLESIYLLSHSGWSIERILRICLSRMGTLKNAPNASGPTPETVPVFKDFNEAAKLIRNLQVMDALNIFPSTDGKNPGLTFEFDGNENTLPELRKLNALLGLSRESDRFTLTMQPAPDSEQQIRIETRSLLGIMYYLSHAVETLEEDRGKGKVTLTRTAGGEFFNWAEVTGDVLQIRAQSNNPPQAAMAVFYRDTWFYIDDSDLASKSTFSMLSQIFSLQAGNAKDMGPLLTLPIGN